MSETQNGMTAEEIFNKQYHLASGKEADNMTRHHMKWAINAMKEYAAQQTAPQDAALKEKDAIIKMFEANELRHNDEKIELMNMVGKSTLNVVHKLKTRNESELADKDERIKQLESEATIIMKGKELNRIAWESYNSNPDIDSSDEHVYKQGFIRGYVARDKFKKDLNFNMLTLRQDNVSLSKLIASLRSELTVQKARGDRLEDQLVDAGLAIGSCKAAIKEIRAALIWQNTHKEAHILGKTDADLIRMAWETIKKYETSKEFQNK